MSEVFIMAKCSDLIIEDLGAQRLEVKITGLNKARTQKAYLNLADLKHMVHAINESYRWDKKGTREKTKQ